MCIFTEACLVSWLNLCSSVAKLVELFILARCYSQTQLDVHIPHKAAAGGQSASVCPKGRGVGETHSGCTRQHAAYQYKRQLITPAAGVSPNIRAMRVQRCFIFYRSRLKAGIASKKDRVKSRRANPKPAWASDHARIHFTSGSVTELVFVYVGAHAYGQTSAGPSSSPGEARVPPRRRSAGLRVQDGVVTETVTRRRARPPRVMVLVRLFVLWRFWSRSFKV